MLQKNRKIIIIVAIVIILLLLIAIIFFKNKDVNNLLTSRIREIIRANKEETIVDYEIINLDGENIELLFIIENEKGIEKITGTDIELDCNGKTKVALDRFLKEGDIYQFKVKLEGENTEELFTFIATIRPKISITNEDTLGDGTTETAQIEYQNNENITNYYSLDNGENWQVYTGEINVPKGETENILAKIEWNEGKTINKPLRYTELIDVNYDEENSLRTITIKYNENYTNGTTKYYRIGETREWQEYTGTITLNDSDIDLNDIKKGTNKLVIYAKQMLGEGTISISECEEEITTTVKLDIFNDVKVSGKTLTEYGFSASWKNGEIKSFAIGNFQAGHSAGEASWSGTFNLTNVKTYGATHLYIDFYQLAQKRHGNASWAQTKVTVSYKDGTSMTKQNTALYGTVENATYVHYPTELELINSNINNMQFYLWRIRQRWFLFYG